MCSLFNIINELKLHIYIYTLNPGRIFFWSEKNQSIFSWRRFCLVAPRVAVPLWATETVLSPWLVADEDRVSHVLSNIVWWKYTSNPGRNFFWSEKNQSMFQLEEILKFVQKLYCIVFPLVLQGLMIRISIFLILYEKYQMSSYITYRTLDRNRNGPMSVAMNLIDFMGSLSIMAWISLTNSFLF